MKRVTVSLQETTGGNCLKELIEDAPEMATRGLYVTIEEQEVDEATGKTTTVVSLETEDEEVDISGFVDAVLAVYRLLGSDVKRLQGVITNE